MSRTLLTVLFFAACSAAPAATLSYTGSLDSPEDYFLTTVTLHSTDNLILQTWGFGGGINGNGTPIPAGGFDPLVAVFSGAGPSATIVDGSSDILSNYGSYTGCPPAGTVTIGSSIGNCGDLTMSFVLPAGTYTIILSDAGYIPNALFDNGTFAEDFTDLTGGVFQTCVDAQNCITGTSNWALDISGRTLTATPEPSTLGMGALAGLALLARFTRRR